MIETHRTAHRMDMDACPCEQDSAEYGVNWGVKAEAGKSHGLADSAPAPDRAQRDGHLSPYSTRRRSRDDSRSPHPSRIYLGYRYSIQKR